MVPEAFKYDSRMRIQRYYGRQERPPREKLIIDEKKPNGMYRLSESERNELKRKANVRGN